MTASLQLFRNLGSTIGVAVFGGILTAGVTSSLGNIEKINQQIDKTLPRVVQQQVAAMQLPKPMQEQVAVDLTKRIKKDFETKQDDFNTKVVNAFSDSLRTIFYGSSILMFTGFIVSLFVTEKTLKSGKPNETSGTE